jgi:hypothetical protein
MNKFLLLVAAVFITLSANAQRPKIMVVPSDDWCKENGFLTTINNQGMEIYVPEYSKALVSFPDLSNVLGKIGEEMQKDGFTLEDLSQTIKNIEQERAEEAVMTSKSGDVSTLNALDKLRSTAQTDIEFHVYWKIEKQGPRKRVSTFRLKGVDTFTGKQVAYAEGSGEWISASNASDADLLREAVQSKLDGFKNSLQTTFDDMVTNGREIKVVVRVWDSWGKDLESTDYGDEELQVLIEEWVLDNAVNHKAGSPIGTGKKLTIAQVRIPLFDERQKRMNGTTFGRKLKKYLQSIGINEAEIKVLGSGPGVCEIMLGEK